MNLNLLRLPPAWVLCSCTKWGSGLTLQPRRKTCTGPGSRITFTFKIRDRSGHCQHQHTCWLLASAFPQPEYGSPAITYHRIHHIHSLERRTHNHTLPAVHSSDAFSLMTIYWFMMGLLNQSINFFRFVIVGNEAFSTTLKHKKRPL